MNTDGAFTSSPLYLWLSRILNTTILAITTTNTTNNSALLLIKLVELQICQFLLPVA